MKKLFLFTFAVFILSLTAMQPEQPKQLVDAKQHLARLNAQVEHHKKEGWKSVSTKEVLELQEECKKAIPLEDRVEMYTKIEAPHETQKKLKITIASALRECNYILKDL